MVRCSVLGCKSDSEKKIPGLSFHSFPKNDVTCRKWIEATGRTKWTVKKTSRICSRHFDQNLLFKKGKLSVLLPNAVPTKEIKIYIQRTSFLTSTEDVNMEIDENSRNIANIDSASSSRSIMTQMGASDGNLPAYNKSPDYSPRTLKRKWKKAQYVSQQRLGKLKALREKSRRLIKKVANLENILAELQSKLLIQAEDCEFLATINTTNKDFLRKILCSSDTKRKYSPSLRKFALCLHFLSPRAYIYVRKTFNTCLPHPSTLRSWYKSVDGNPGFTSESFTCIKRLANCEKAKGKTLFCALSMDEMAIRKHIQWDGNKSVGFVNFGEVLDGDSATVAREALVFMVTAVNGSWKLPVGYFLVDGCNGAQKANLVKQCIKLLTACGVQTLSLTFDGCPANFTMAKNLGCILEPTNIKCTFDVGGQELVIFPDPSHMLKLVRNTIGEKKELTNVNGHRISWSYVTQLHELQQKEGIHLANKLRSQHVNYDKQKMKVRLAAQTFSNSVALAIQFCDEQLHLSEFSSSAATVEFIKNFDTIFDILNSRNLQSYTYKKPLNKNNFYEIAEFIDKMEKYLNSLKLYGQPIMMTNRKVGFLGLYICMSSLKWIFENFVATEAMKFVPMYKFSQDHLECFFSSVRSRGGYNNNPTAIQFASAYKRLIVHGEIKHLASGNCIPLEEIKILTFSEMRHETKLNVYTKLSDSYEVNFVNEVQSNEYDVIDDDHDYLADPARLTIYAREVITYIAGFIVKKLKKVIRCEDCLWALVTEKFDGIIEKRDKGGLIYPSKDVIKICDHAEKIFRRHLHKGPSFFKEKNLLPKLVLSCFKACSYSVSRIFKNNHFDSQPLIGNHRSLLIKSVAMHYFETRLHHATKEKFAPEERVRNIHNKLVLFQGQ